jgi:hypothetical protein
MPSPAIPKRAKDYILYYYARLVIAPAAGHDGNYRFIIDRYKRLADGSLLMSTYDREIQKLARSATSCAFCGERGRMLPTRLVPQTLGGPIGIHNQVYSCEPCLKSKAELEFITWWLDTLGRELDDLPRVPTGLFLKLAYERRVANFTLNAYCDNIRQLWPLN